MRDLVECARHIGDSFGDPREVEPRPREHRLVGDDLLELVARVLVGTLFEQDVREPPAGPRGRGVALELRAELLLAHHRHDVAVVVEHVVRVLAVAVEHERERVELAGQPAIEARGLAYVVLDRVVVTPDLAAMVERDGLAVLDRELPAAGLEANVACRHQLEAVDVDPRPIAVRVELDQRRRQPGRQIVGRRFDIVKPGSCLVEDREHAIERVAGLAAPLSGHQCPVSGNAPTATIGSPAASAPREHGHDPGPVGRHRHRGELLASGDRVLPIDVRTPRSSSTRMSTVPAPRPLADDRDLAVIDRDRELAPQQEVEQAGLVRRDLRHDHRELLEHAVVVEPEREHRRARRGSGRGTCRRRRGASCLRRGSRP